MNKLNKKLNLTPNKKEVGRNSVVSRRESVVKGINNQLLICESLINDGEVYRDFNGRKVISWFWLNEEGKYFLSINYGKKGLLKLSYLNQHNLEWNIPLVEFLPSMLDPITREAFQGDYKFNPYNGRRLVPSF